MEKMLAYHNDPAIKLKYQARFEAHRRADEVIQGTGFENGRGCFVGCTLDAYDHSRFPVELGWPEWLAHLADGIFEGIPREEAPQFGTDLLEAVQPGKDLEPVRWQLAALRHRKQLAALAGNEEEYAVQVRAALEQAIAYCESEMKTDESRAATARAAWSAESAAVRAAAAARSVARSVARSAWSAESAAWSAESAAWSARSVAWSVAWSSSSAAWSARSAAAWSARSARSEAAAAAGWSAGYRWERDTLLSLLRNM